MLPFAYLRQQNKALKFAVVKNINIFTSILFNLYFLLLGPNMQNKGIMIPLFDGQVGIKYVFISHLIACIITIPLLFVEIKKIRLGFDARVWKQMVRYGAPLIIVGFAGMLVAFSFIFVGIKQQKDANNGEISFRKAFTTGFWIALIASIMYVIAWLFIYYTIFPNFIEQFSEMPIKNAKPENVAKVTEEMNQYKEWYKSPIMIILSTLMEILPFGIIISLIGALVYSVILKKKN